MSKGNVMNKEREIFKIWVAATTSDEYGREGSPIGYFTDRAMAKAAAKDRGWYGSDGLCYSVYAVKLDGKYYILKGIEPVEINVDFRKQKNELIKSGLSKLTPEEIKALEIDNSKLWAD